MNRKQRMMENNNGWPVVNQLLDGAPFFAQLTNSLVLNRGTGSPTYTGATTKTFPDNEGVLRTAIAGEARFVGARRVRNLLPASTEDLSSAGFTRFNATASTDTLTASVGAGFHYTYSGSGSYTAATKYIYSVEVERTNNDWIFVGLNDGQLSYFNTTTGLFGTTDGTVSSASATLVSAGVYRIALAAIPGAVAVKCTVGIANANGGASFVAVGTETIKARKFQLEDITGRADQTTPSEYVSVGALDYRSTQDPLYLSLPGTAGHYASTPDSVAASVTGDIDIRVKVAMADWTPTTYANIISKWVGATYSYTFQFDTTVGRLLLAGNSGGFAAVSSVGTGFTDGTTHWVRGTRVAATGVVTFYTSEDGESWGQLGTPVAGTAGAISDDSVAVGIGGNSSGPSALNGKIFSAQIYDEIDGTTPVVDFNPHRDATTPAGTITSSTTGEVWTINGASSVVRNAAYHGSMVDGVKCYDTDLSGNPIAASTLKGYLAEPAATNLCLQSQTIATAPWQVGVGIAATADQYVAPDGTTTMDKLTAIGGYTQHFWFQQITTTAATHTYSAYVRYVNNQWMTLGIYDGAGSYYCAFDILNGVVGSTFGTVIGAIEATEEAGVFRVSITATVAANVLSQIYFGVVNADDPSFGLWPAVGTEAIGVWGAQVELGSAATSYIPTTTVAVARNADVLTYTGGDIANIKTLAATFRREAGVSAAGWAATLSDGTVNNYMSVSVDSATESRFLGVSGGAVQWDATPSYTAGTQSKASFSAATNDIKMDKDGTAQAQDTIATVPTVTQLNVGHAAGSFVLNGHVGHIYGWTTNKSQSELSAVDR
mgnify:FL=1